MTIVSERQAHAPGRLPLVQHNQQQQQQQKQEHRRGQHSSKKAGAVALVLVVVWLLLRYVVEVKVSVRWRTLGSLQQQQQQQQQPGLRKHCSNSCFKARNGICDEGRPHANPTKQQQQEAAQRQQGMPPGVSAVHCDLGTDCRDCGPWFGAQADSNWSEPLLPVAFLRSHNVSVRARPTSANALPANFSFAFTDPALDWDVSKHVQQDGLLEIGISQVFYKLLAGRCRAGGPGGLVADVGANFGWHALLAASFGCRVIAWEPVPQFRALLALNLARNGLSQLVSVRPAVVAHPPGSKQVVVIPNRGIWGTAGIGGANVDLSIHDKASGPPQQVEVVAESLDEVLAGQHVDLLKVDVEGYEPSVLATAQALLTAGAVDNIVLEYSPGVYERSSRWSEMDVHPRMLLDLTKAGFRLMHMPDTFTRVWWDGRAVAGAIPKLREVTPTNLKYDLWDAAMYSTGALDPTSKPFCPAMVALGLNNQGIPERLHPKSLHSAFGHNTNVWATKDAKIAEELIGPPEGVIPLSQPINASWFPPESVTMGLGGVSCRDVVDDLKSSLSLKSKRDVAISMTVLIGRRCRCVAALPCKEYEAAAEACAKEGTTPYVDLP
uniref:Methyltransferase FkbM domain-containing protein n=1 Tax=Tetradesmus obliquus TaxID=3088 RepID=A0A383VY30_TETOB|eukprot:jgi/Sobl393_1/11807/SZX70368.1